MTAVRIEIAQQGGGAVTIVADVDTDIVTALIHSLLNDDPVVKSIEPKHKPAVDFEAEQPWIACADCDQKFTSTRGLAVHRGQMHKPVVSEPWEVAS